VKKIKHIPAIAATGDRVTADIVQPYYEMAEKIGLTREYLKDLATCIDFESHYIRFMESRGLVNDLFGDNVENQRQIVALLIEEINKKKDVTLQAARHYMHIDNFGELVLVSLEADKVTSRGSFPAIGMTTGMTHDSVMADNPGKPVITLGLGPDFITMRMSDEVNFKLDDLIKELQEKVPFGAIDGGGHEHAGTIKFLEAARSEVHKIVYDRFRNN
jgi:RecJ-like exonuclease